MRRSPLENFRHSHFPVADDSSITFNEVKRKFLFEEYYFYRKKMNMSLFMKTLIQKKKKFKSITDYQLDSGVYSPTFF